MAITLKESTVNGSRFAANGYSADLSGCETLKAAPGAGYYIYVDQISISCAADINVTIGAGETTSAVTAVILGPITFKAAGGNFFTVAFKQPIKLAANTALTADASGAGAVTIFVEGYVSG